MRSGDVHLTTCPEQAVELFHRAYHIADVLDHMDGADIVKRSVGEGIREAVQVAQHVRAGACNAIYTDRAGILLYTAADVEDARSFARSVRHSSSVSMAQSA